MEEVKLASFSMEEDSKKARKMGEVVVCFLCIIVSVCASLFS
jgi:hypothetical protein